MFETKALQNASTIAVLCTVAVEHQQAASRRLKT
jgi:hypothetical protein